MKKNVVFLFKMETKMRQYVAFVRFAALSLS